MSVWLGPLLIFRVGAQYASGHVVATKPRHVSTEVLVDRVFGHIKAPPLGPMPDDIQVHEAG
eukprot:11670158-Alexandrium_andersonii.AAC.1